MMDDGNPFCVIHAHFGLVNFPLHFSIFVQNWHFYASPTDNGWIIKSLGGRRGRNKWQSKLVHLPFYTPSHSALFVSTQLSLASDTTHGYFLILSDTFSYFLFVSDTFWYFLILSVCVWSLKVVNNQSWQVRSDDNDNFANFIMISFIGLWLLPLK